MDDSEWREHAVSEQRFVTRVRTARRSMRGLTHATDNCVALIRIHLRATRLREWLRKNCIGKRNATFFRRRFTFPRRAPRRRIGRAWRAAAVDGVAS